MRRIFGLLLAGVFMVTMAACGGGGGGGSKDAFCGAVKDFKAKGDSLANVDYTDAKNLDALNSLVKSLEAKAPSEIKADMKVIADFFAKFVPDLKAAGSDPTKLEALGTKYAADEDKVTAAEKKVETYSKKECGVSISSDDSDSSDSSSSSSKKSSSSDSTDLSDFSFDTDSFNSYLSSLSDAFSDFSDLSDFSPN